MSQVDVLDILRSKNASPHEFNFDNMWIPPMNEYLSVYDVEKLHEIATSISLSSKTEERYKLIKDIMTSRGFARFAAGTNRLVFRYYEDQRFVVKVATDKIGIEANLAEYWNQQLLAPYCAKTFYTSPCGSVAFAERLMPITSRAEYLTVVRLAFRLITDTIVGRLVVDDIGTDYFRNLAVRANFGLALIDYPYVYPLDGNLLYCNKILDNGTLCDGAIDYDDGFNKLICTKCGKRYFARDLRNRKSENTPIIYKGGLTNMKINLMKGDKVVFSSVRSTDVIQKPPVKREKSKSGMVVKLMRGSQEVNLHHDDEEKKEEVMAEKEMPIKDNIGITDSVTIVRHYDKPEEELIEQHEFSDAEEGVEDGEEYPGEGRDQESEEARVEEVGKHETKEIEDYDGKESKEDKVEEQEEHPEYKEYEDAPTFEKIQVPRNRAERRQMDRQFSATAHRDKRDPAIRSNFNRGKRR